MFRLLFRSVNVSSILLFVLQGANDRRREETGDGGGEDVVEKGGEEKKNRIKNEKGQNRAHKKAEREEE